MRSGAVCLTQAPVPPYNGCVLAPGTLAPEFTLPDQDGTEVSLAQARGHWVVLWWYPKAATPG